MAAASEITDLTDGSSLTATPGSRSIAVGKAAAYAGPSLANLVGVFSTPPTAASTRTSSSSLAPAGRSRRRSLPPPSGTPDFSNVRAESCRFRQQLEFGLFWYHPMNVLCPANGRPALELKCMW
jgi:hypothetical protein